MAAATMTEYERQRLENIRRNDEVMASLMIRRKASDVTAILKRRSTADLKRSAAHLKKPKKEKDKTEKPRFQTPIVVRRSLRHRGLPPDPSLPFADHQHNTPRSTNDSPSPARKRETLHIGDAFLEGPNSSDRHLLKMIKSASDRQSTVDLRKGVKEEDLFDPKKDLMLREANVKRLLAGRVLSVQFLPFRHRSVIVAGDKLGHVGFWDVDAVEVEGEGDGLFVYAPHSAPVSGISVHPFSSAKIFTCSYDGLIRLMDVRNESYNMIYSSNCLIYSICQSPDNVSSIYFGEGAGGLKLWDERAGKVSNTWDLHEQRINTIDFHPENTNMVATSSTDGLACIWDLRKLKKHRSERLNTIEHKRAVHSAYFSPGGIYLATTSVDDTVGILRGVNFGDLSLVKHDNQTGRWLSSFRAIWGWDDSYLFVGNMKRAIDVISTDVRTTALVSDYMTSIPCRFAAHPYNVGSLAGTTAAGKVFYWTRK